MNVLSLRNALALVFAAFIVVGCSSQSEKPQTETPVPEDTSGTDNTVVEPVEEPGLSEEELAEQRRKEMMERKQREMEALREVRVFYFDFDKSFIKPEAREYIKAHAQYLRSNPSVSVVLNGYADERGTKEYNLALGERRGLSVRNYLEVNGARRSQIEVVSFGEEFPADSGHNEAAWAKNRRVVLEYK